MDVDIGNLLYLNDFKSLSMEFYRKVDFNKLDDQALVNIVESLLEEKNFEDTLRFAYRAIEQGNIDYRIFKMAIEVLSYLEIQDEKKN